MYSVNELTIGAHQYLELVGPEGISKAHICLTQGARLTDLMFQDTQILANLSANDYAVHYASAVLFPFANRIKNGAYTFNGEHYQLFCNEVAKNNAIHGLVYNKTFITESKETATTHAAVTLAYDDDGLHQGFPFKFGIKLTYTLYDNSLRLAIEVSNNDCKPFPFTLGWHPYFVSQNLAHSAMSFDCSIAYKTDEQQIITDTMEFDKEMPWSLNGLQLDHSFALQSNAVKFYTPGFALTIRSSAAQNFLQVYTPTQPNLIAIEPMVGTIDSFNNAIGLQTLTPDSSFSMHWDLSMQLAKNDSSSITFMNP